MVGAGSQDEGASIVSGGISGGDVVEHNGPEEVSIREVDAGRGFVAEVDLAGFECGALLRVALPVDDKERVTKRSGDFELFVSLLVSGVCPAGQAGEFAEGCSDLTRPFGVRSVDFRESGFHFGG